MQESLKPPGSSQEGSPSPWTPGMVQAILSGVTPLADRYIGLKEKEFDYLVNSQAAESRAAWWVLALLMAFLAMAIGLMSWLTYVGRVSGDALLFLVGTVSGYTLALVQRHLFPPEVIGAPEM